MKQTNIMVEGAMMAAIFAVFMGMTLYVPLLSLLSVWLLPLPLVVFTVRNGWRMTVLLLCVIFVLSLILGSFYGLGLAFLYAGSGIVIGSLYRMRKSAFTVLFGGSLAFTAEIIVIFILCIVLFNFNLISYTIQIGHSAFQQIQHISSSLGESDKKSMKAIQSEFDMLRYMAPFIFVVIGTVYALITQLIAAPVLKRIGLREYVQPWLPFREWRFPKSILWYYLVFLLIGFFQHFTKGSMWYIGYYNLFSALQVVILIQGFSFIFFYFHAREKPRVVPVLIVIATICFAAILAPFVELIGLLDLGFDFRNRLQSK